MKSRPHFQSVSSVLALRIVSVSIKIKQCSSSPPSSGWPQFTSWLFCHYTAITGVWQENRKFKFGCYFATLDTKSVCSVCCHCTIWQAFTSYPVLFLLCWVSVTFQSHCSLPLGVTSVHGPVNMSKHTHTHTHTHKRKSKHICCNHELQMAHLQVQI